MNICRRIKLSIEKFKKACLILLTTWAHITCTSAPWLAVKSAYVAILAYNALEMEERASVCIFVTCAASPLSFFLSNKAAFSLRQYSSGNTKERPPTDS